VFLSQRDTTNVANVANNEKSVNKRPKRNVRLSHAPIARRFATESAEVGKEASETMAVAATDEMNVPLPEGSCVDETDPVKRRLQMRQKRSSVQVPSQKERCAVPRRDAKRIKMQGKAEAYNMQGKAEAYFLIEGRRAVASKSRANDSAENDVTIIVASTDREICSQPLGRANVDHNSQATATTCFDETQYYNLAPPAFDPSKLTVGISSYDSSSQGNVLAVPDYATDIFQRLYHREVRATHVSIDLPTNGR
jgi:hypothetical protein